MRKMPVDYVLSQRETLVIDCLTILRAHKLARERDDPTLPMLDTWGSFVAWGETIREAIVWADEEGCDPVATNMELKAAHPEQAQLMAVLDAWYQAFGDGQKTSADVRNHCQANLDGDLMNAIGETEVRIERGEVNTKSLGAWLTYHANRPGKYTLKREEKSRKWHVECRPEPQPNQRPREVMQAVRELLNGFPRDFSFHGVTLGRGPLYECLLQVRNDDWLIALRDMYKDGHQLAEQLKNIRDFITYLGPENEPMTSADSIRQVYPDWNNDLLGAAWLSHTIYSMAWAADMNRPKGPAYQQAQDRFNRLGTMTPNDDIALNVLSEADRQSGACVEDAEVLLPIAVDLLVEELTGLPLDEAGFYNSTEIVNAMKKLVGLEGRAPEDGQTNRTTLGQGRGA